MAKWEQEPDGTWALIEDGRDADWIKLSGRSAREAFPGLTDDEIREQLRAAGQGNAPVLKDPASALYEGRRRGR